MWSIIGQSRATSLLQKGLETGSLAHAYLFVGLAHVGKMTLALNLAQAVNCTEPDAPCGKCSACQRISQGKHADVQIIGLKADGDETGTKSRSEISIEQIRNIQYSVSIPAFEGKFKVFIVDEAERLSIEAANCLLKTLEEPSNRVVFILLTVNESLLPATVISRCQRLELFPLPVVEIETALVKQWGIEPEKSRLLAHLCHGCLGWAVHATDDAVLKQRSEQLDELTGLPDADGEERFAYAARLATLFSRDSALVQQRLELWRDWWRDLLLVKIGLKETVTNADRLPALLATADKYGLRQIREYIESIRMASRQLRQNANPQLVLEVLMLAIPPAGRVAGEPVRTN